MRRLLGISAAFLFASAALASEDVIRRGFRVAEGGTLHLNGAVGNIKVVSGGNGLAVEITRKAHGRRAEREMARHRIDIQQRGNDVVIESDFGARDRGWNWFHWYEDYEVQWNVRVPSKYNVDVSTSGGAIDLADIGGTVEARTSGGSIKTGRLSGPSNLKTSGGNITVAGATAALEAHTSGGSIKIGDTSGSVEAKTSGGSITLARMDGDVVARTSGGGINIEDLTGGVDARTSGGSIHARLTRQPRADTRLATSGGRVVVTLAPSIAVDLDAHASGGGVDAEVPVTVQGRQDDQRLQGKINGGGPKLMLRTSGGGIRVRKL